MLSNRLRKYITFEQRKKFIQVFKEEFTDKEYLIFLRKFRGSMLSKGRSSLSYKFYDYIRIYFKKILKREEFRHLDVDKVIKSAISNLIPVLGTANLKRVEKLKLFLFC